MTTNSKDSTIVSGSKGNDTIVNYGNYVTVKADAGNDWIGNYGKNSVIIAGTGHDTVYGLGENVSIDAGSGSDFVWISNTGGWSTVKSGAGKDTIGIDLRSNYDYETGTYHGRSGTTYVKVTDLSEDDTIYFYESVDTITANAFGLSRKLWLSKSLSMTEGMTLDLGKITNKKLEKIKKVKVINGDKTTTLGALMDRKISVDDNAVVYGTNNNDKIEFCGNNNLVYGYGGNDTIISDSQNNSTVYAGRGNDQISGYSNGKNHVYYGEDGNDSFSIYTSNVTIYGGKGNDTVQSPRDNTMIYGEDGNDSIRAYDFKNSTISGGNGNDTVDFISGVSDVSLNGGAGEDFFLIPASNKNITITGGKGKDTIQLGYWYTRDYSSSSCGAVITDLKSNEDAVRFYNKINSLTASKSGKNLILTDDSKLFSVTLAGATSTDEIKDVVVFNGDYSGNAVKTTIGALLTNKIGTTKKKTQLDVVQDFMHSLDETELKGVEAVDEAVRFASSGQFENYSKLIENFVADCKKTKDSETFLKNYCGIDLNNDDTGAITGWDAGGIDVKTASNIVPEVRKLNKNFTNNSFKVNGVTFKLDKQFKKLNKAETYIWQALYTWWARSSLELISKSYGDNFSFTEKSSATVKNIKVKFVRGKLDEEVKNFSAWVTWDQGSNGIQSKPLDLTVNMNIYDDINESVSDGILNHSENNVSLDRILAHEFTHAIMAANIPYIDELPNSIKEGIPEITHGADGRSAVIKKLVEDSSLLERALEFSTDYNNVAGDSTDYASGYTLLRYLAKQVSKKSGMQEGIKCNGDKTSIKLTSEFKGTFKADEYFSTIKNIDASRDKNSVTIYGNTKDNNILGDSGKDKLYGYAGKDVINGGAGDDMLTGGKGNDNLTGGKGKDIFAYANGDGKDTITDYTAGQDKIKITKGSIGSFKITGTDIVFTIGKGSINIKNGAGKKITVIDSNGKETSKVYGISREVSSLWFADEDINFSISSVQIDSITENGLSGYSLGNVDAATDWTALTPKDSLTSGLTFSDK